MFSSLAPVALASLLSISGWIEYDRVAIARSWARFSLSVTIITPFLRQNSTTPAGKGQGKNRRRAQAAGRQKQSGV